MVCEEDIEGKGESVILMKLEELRKNFYMLKVGM